MWAKHIPAIALLSLLTISIAFNIDQHAQITQYKFRPFYSSDDGPAIKRAVELWSEKAHVAQADVMYGRFAKTVHLGNETCVSLSIDPSMILAGEPAYCFDSNSNKLTRRYDNVE